MRNSFVYLLILVAILAVVVTIFRPSSGSAETRSLTTVIADAKAGSIERIEVRDDKIRVFRKDGTDYESRKEKDVSIYTVFGASGVDASSIDIVVKSPKAFGNILELLLNFLPILIFIGLIVLVMRKGLPRPPEPPTFPRI